MPLLLQDNILIKLCSKHYIGLTNFTKRWEDLQQNPTKVDNNSSVYSILYSWDYLFNKILLYKDRNRSVSKA